MDTQPLIALDGTVHLVIGASGGIGSRVARSLVQGGGQVVLAGRDSAKINGLADEFNGRAVTIRSDGEESWKRCFEQALDWRGRLDGVLNCAGSVLLKPAHLTTEEEFDQVIQDNLKTAFYSVKGAARAMRTSGGSVVLMSSAAAEVGLAHHEAIAAAKAGVVGLARSAAATYAANGLRVNVVAPGLVDTPLSEKITSHETALAASISMHPLGRIGAPDDVATAICWLLSKSSSWVTGQVIGLDGGLSSLRVRART
ncbi:MAG: SDR family NAD(P)-dependent oxidoreductase [Planctomycetota bacterium]|jgi:NAD(P)-dependent dehydrogenase (short-subunit alcohol dehydrogenase family)